MRFFSMLFIFSLFISCEKNLDSPISGYYQDAELGLSFFSSVAYFPGLNEMSGYFDAPGNDCDFYWAGHFSGYRNNIVLWENGKKENKYFGVAYFPEDREGLFFIRLHEGPEGLCPELQAGHWLNLEEEKPFIRIRSIMGGINLFPNKNGTAPIRLSGQELFYQIDEEDGWAKGYYRINNNWVEAWAKEKDLPSFPG